MRLFIINLLLTVGLLQHGLAARGQGISLHAKDAALKNLFKQIKDQSGYGFIYTNELLDKARPVSIDVKNVAINEVLSICFSGQPFSYRLDGNMVTVIALPLSVLSNSSFKTALDTLTIQAKVTDTLGNPLHGASIRLRLGKGYAVSDAHGLFSLHSVQREDILLVSYLGFESREIPAASSSLTFVLKKSESKLDQVVVMAYGNTTRRLNTGDIGRVNSVDIENQPVLNPLSVLDGKIPGLVITQTTGLPGGAFKVEVRGRTALDRNLSDDQPLFIVDGMPIAANNGYTNLLSSALGYPNNINISPLSGGISPLNGIDPRQIESIEVLKDADATAIYGSRGANGVVIITTKKGKAGRTQVEFNAYKGISEAARPVKMMKTPDYLDMRNAAFKNDGETPDDYDFYNYYNAYDLRIWDTTRYTNFYKLLDAHTAQNNDAQLAVSGGNNQTQFRIAGNFHQESTITPGDMSYLRGGVNFNINHRSTNDRLSISLTGTYNADKNDLVTTDPSSYLNLPPNLQVYDDRGSLAWNEGNVVAGLTGQNNPLSFLNRSYLAKTSNLIGNLEVNYVVSKQLTIRSSFGYNSVASNEQSLNPSTAQNPLYDPTRSSETGVNQFKSWIIEPQAEYTTLLGPGKLDVLAGGSWQATDNDGLRIFASGYSSDALLRALSGATSYEPTTTRSQYRYQAIFGRINYNIKDKYLLNLSARRDGSSRFATENQWANYAAVGAAWIWSNESFFQQIPWISFGKLRASYGITGNDKIQDYQYLDTWRTTFTPYQAQPGLYPYKLYNADYHWEKNKKLEGALDLGFIQDRILLSVTYYNNRSSNQLVNYKLPYLTGFSSIVTNMDARVENKGWEFTLQTKNIAEKDFNWTTNFNISLPKNTLLKFPGLKDSPYASTLVEGQSLNLIYQYRYTGIDTQRGVYTFEDINQDGVMSEADYQVLGTLDPKYYGGIQNSFQYKNFHLDVMFSFRKQLGRNYLASLDGQPGGISNLPAVMKGGFWTGVGDSDAAYQQLSQAYDTDAYNAWYDFIDHSNGIYSDASFLRLKNVSLSYSFSPAIIRSLHLSQLKVYVLGQNLLTMTPYKLGDPELQTYTRTPPLKSYTAGLQLTF